MAPLICWSFSNSMFRYLLVDHAVPAGGARGSMSLSDETKKEKREKIAAFLSFFPFCLRNVVSSSLISLNNSPQSSSTVGKLVILSRPFTKEAPRSAQARRRSDCLRRLLDLFASVKGLLPQQTAITIGQYRTCF